MIPDSFFQAEVRNGFAVTEKRKRIWAAELTLLTLFDNFCRLHDLQYFAAGIDYLRGTVIGLPAITVMSILTRGVHMLLV